MGDKRSRLNKFEKRRKTTKSISILLILGSILVIVLLGIWIFGGSDDKNDKAIEEPKEEASDITINDDADKEDDSGDKVTKGDDESSDKDDSSETGDQENYNQDEDEDNNEEIETEEATPSDDNVSDAYTGDWSAVGTEQEGPHTTDYTDGSQDRIEIKKASAVATGLDEGNMRTWWVGNGGDQKVVSTVSSADQSEKYRVFLSWIDGEGWKPTKVEELKEMDY